MCYLVRQSVEQDLSIDMMHLFQVLVSLVLAIALGSVIYWYVGIRQTKTALYPERLPSDTSLEKEVGDLSDPELTPKHNIFLSHSGAQKPFVEQLCKDLEAGCHYPFLDIRDNSLPKGKKFAPLIFQAARQCRVAVIVLSKEFLSSKWPMLELAEFVSAIESDNRNLILLPLFFKLSVSDLSDESISKTWMLEWTKLAGKNSKSGVDIEKWKKAVKELRAVNGLNFANFGNSEVTYREAVVKAIFKAVPPDLLYDTSEVQGCDRMCKILSGMFVEHTSSSDRRLPQPQKLGLYGMGGLGKTTMCKALCNLFQAEFCGRVCHVELGSEIPLILQKRVLKKMLRVSEDVLQNITNTSEGQKLLREKMRSHPVFLVIDNVGDSEDCRTEARAFLRAKFHPLSKIMVTSRSNKVVEALLEEPEYCKPIPDLMIEEAAAIFLSIAAPGKEFRLSLLSYEERNIVDICLKECLFSPDGDSDAGHLKKYGQYHPLALGALGVYFHDISSSNVLLWKTRLNEYDKLKRSRDCPRIFRILGLQFGTFDETKKLIFLDVALYARGWLGSLRFKSFEHCVMWLGALHNESNLKKVEDKLGDLQRNAMINLGESAVTTHDLYKEYAEWYVSKDGDAKARWCVYQEHADDSFPHELESSAPGGWWPDLMRISMEGNLKYARFTSKKVQEWRNTVVLQLHSCSELSKLDLHGFSCLCHLELVDLKKLDTLIFAQDDEDECPRKLQFALLMKLTALKHLPSFSPCAGSLRMFTMRDCSPLTESLASLESCSRLETLEMDWFPGLLAPNLSAMTVLNKLSLVDTGAHSKAHPIEELEGLGSLMNLRFLNLSNLPIKRLPGLENLSNLRHISLEHCSILTELPDLTGLPHVQVLNVSWTKVREIPGLDTLLQLRTLDCRYCLELVGLPDLDHLSRLRIVTTRGCSLLTKNPRVPKHPCVHDKDPIVRACSKENMIRQSESSESEPDFDPFDFFDGYLLQCDS